ncbi:alpha/beta-hydrolase [Nemania sp. FL0916]|nr:alpha/beta-hydrolase [Nemania sp. FL0916]
MAQSDCIESPRATLLPLVTAEEAVTLAYPPNALPGARDVEAFYGTMRVYEWGPEDGSKVLFVHGDATPCLVFANIAQTLVDAGYRVMLFGKLSAEFFCVLPNNDRLSLPSFLDLWGRGYSDSPLQCRHDARLFATQMLLALASSQQSWMGSGNGFSIVAFSLGGPISLTFTAAFPESVWSLVLLGPAGLLRKLPEGYDDELMQQPRFAPSRPSIREKVREILGVNPSNVGVPSQAPQVLSLALPSRVESTFDMGAIL